MSSDSADLEALFDSVASKAMPVQKTKPVSDAASSKACGGDSADLEALFETVSAEQYGHQPQGGAASVAQQQEGGECSADEVITRVGKLTRSLHDSLQELGLDTLVEDAAKKDIPDARERLLYVAEMTAKAANRALNAVDVAKPIQDELEASAQGLSSRWDALMAGNLSVDEFKALAASTQEFLKKVPVQTGSTSAQLMEIMMAQDFQDLTGQVIKKTTGIVQTLEQGLLQLLLDTAPAEKRTQANEGLLNGPVVNAKGRNDVVTNQDQVDDLLESLGF